MSDLKLWYMQQNEDLPTEEEIDEMRREYEAQEATRLASGLPPKEELPDEEIPF